jgi:hypothetical protein
MFLEPDLVLSLPLSHPCMVCWGYDLDILGLTQGQLSPSLRNGVGLGDRPTLDS